MQTDHELNTPRRRRAERGLVLFSGHRDQVQFQVDPLIRNYLPGLHASLVRDNAFHSGSKTQKESGMSASCGRCLTLQPLAVTGRAESTRVRY